MIINSIKSAEFKTSKAFENISLNYEIISDYIIRTFDFLSGSVLGNM